MENEKEKYVVIPVTGGSKKFYNLVVLGPDGVNWTILGDEDGPLLFESELDATAFIAQQIDFIWCAYVELLNDCYGYKKGLICRIVERGQLTLDVYSPVGNSTSVLAPNVCITYDYVKPSTKEAYGQQLVDSTPCTFIKPLKAPPSKFIVDLDVYARVFEDEDVSEELQKEALDLYEQTKAFLESKGAKVSE